MAFNISKQETVGKEGEKPRLLLVCDDVTEPYIPQDVQLCRICFATDGKLCSIKMDKKLDRAYGILTGLSIENEDNLPPYLCAECSHQLMHCIHFRDRSLQAHLLLLEVLRKHDFITLETIKTIRKSQNISSLNLNICPVDEQTVHIKKEIIDTDDEICLENVPSQLEDIVLSSIKKENGFTFSQDGSKDDPVFLSNLEDTVLKVIKAEKDDAYYKESLSHCDVTTSSMVYGDSFIGKDEPVENIKESTDEQKQKPKSSNRELTKVTKVKTSNRRKQNAGGAGLLLYDNLCCNVCPYKTVSDVQLLSHIKAHSSAKCNYTAIIKEQDNSSDIRFCCYVCKKTFRTTWFLRKHMKTHYGKKTYVCDVCQRGFTENRDLQNHLRTHSGEKPYCCDLCKKSFSERGNLVRHIRIHAGEKPFTCKVCKISFNQKHHLKRHLTKHTRK